MTLRRANCSVLYETALESLAVLSGLLTAPGCCSCPCLAGVNLYLAQWMFIGMQVQRIAPPIPSLLCRYIHTTPEHYILRENPCATFEAPFMYLLIGSKKRRF